MFLFCSYNTSMTPPLRCLDSDSDSRRLQAMWLRCLLPRLESMAGDRGTLKTGVAAVDRILPGGGLALAAMHALGPAATDDAPAAFGFAMALLALAAGSGSRPVAIVATHPVLAATGRPYPDGLAGLGLDPARLFLVEAVRDADALWAMEEILRARGAMAVTGCVAAAPDLTTGRRLHLAAGAAVTPLFLMATTPVRSSVAATRWKVAAAPPARDPFGMPVRYRWQATLERCRNGRTGEWLVEWDHAAHRFDLAGGLADRPLPLETEAGEPRARSA
jgi:protein ImuA